MKNFWKTKDFSLFSVCYVYVDHNSYLADSLFIQNKIPVKIKGEMVRDDSPYCVVICKVLKKDVMRFEEALLKLKNKMLLVGHMDYEVACDEITQLIEREKEKKEKKRNRCK